MTNPEQPLSLREFMSSLFEGVSPASKIPPLSAEDFLASLYSATGDRAARIRMIRTLDDYICNHNFKTCDEILLKADFSRLNIVQMLGILTATAYAKDQLPNRAGFYSRTRNYILSNDESLDNLDGLE